MSIDAERSATPDTRPDPAERQKTADLVHPATAGPPDVPEGRTGGFKPVGDGRRERLEVLREVIASGTSFAVRLVAPTGADCYLRVVNLEAAKLAEDIGCRIEEDGEYRFTWSWGDVIGPADDVEGAAEAIRRVLTCKD